MRGILTPLALGLPLVLWGWAVSAAPREKAPALVLTPPVQDVVLVTPVRPLALRLQLQVEGVATSVWEQYLDRLFAFLDVDADGALSAAELRCAPSAEQLNELTRDSDVVTAEPAPSVADIAGPGGTVNLKKFKAFYRREGQGPLAVELGKRTSETDEVGEALWKRLDTNQDGKLSRAELKAADRLLATLDQNEDDVIALDEVLGRPAPANFRFDTPVSFRDALARGALVLRGGDRPGELSAGLLGRYDRDRNGRLTRAEVGLDRPLFERFDADRDDEWSSTELDRWLRETSDGKLEVTLGKPGVPAVFVPDKAVQTLRWEGERQRLIVADRALIELAPGRAPEVKATAVLNRLRAQFQQFDANKSGKLERGEVFKPPFAWVAILRLLDRDNDDTITRKELDAWLELHREAVVSVVTLTLADRGPSLFELLDDDRDGRLSPRNLLTAWERLRVWDRDGDNVLGRDEVPRQYHLTLSRGTWRTAADLIAPAYGPAERQSQPRGPGWFRKMDRNVDGDVSPREFLGHREAFRKLDRDNDGLIDATEAEQAPR